MRVQPEDDTGPTETTFGQGPNCSDETKREFYRRAVLTKIAIESAAEVLRSKTGLHRNLLKEAAKAGVDTQAISEVLAIRFNDPDIELIALRERIKMMELSGYLPGLLDKLVPRYAVTEATSKEAEAMDDVRAFDQGTKAGRKGHMRNTNPGKPGSSTHVEWDRGYMTGQAIIADEMGPKTKPKAPKKTPANPAAPANDLHADTIQAVLDEMAQDA